MKRILLILSIIFLGVILKSCCDVADECFIVREITFASYSSQTDTILQPDSRVALNNLVFLMEGEVYWDLCMNPFDGGSNLYALSCPDPEYMSLNKITQISITCDATLTEELEAGDELKELFVVGSFDFNCPADTIDYRDCLWRDLDFEPKNDLEAYFNEYTLNQLYIRSRKDYSLFAGRQAFIINNQIAIIPGWKQFRFSFLFDDGHEIVAMTDRLYIE